MDFTKKFAKTILDLSEMFYKKEQNQENWKRACNLAQNHLPPIQFETIMFLMSENSSRWMHRLKSMDRDIFVNVNSFAEFIRCMRNSFVLHLSEHSHEDNDHSENCFVLSCINMAFTAVYAELLDLNGVRAVVIDEMIEMRFDYEACQPCTPNLDFDLISFRGS